MSVDVATAALTATEGCPPTPDIERAGREGKTSLIFSKLLDGALRAEDRPAVLTVSVAALTLFDPALVGWDDTHGHVTFPGGLYYQPVAYAARSAVVPQPVLYLRRVDR